MSKLLLHVFGLNFASRMAGYSTLSNNVNLVEFGLSRYPSKQSVPFNRHFVVLSVVMNLRLRTKWNTYDAVFVQIR